ncbi:alpha/beta fold hydrolase [Streptomyces sp. NPDC047042]|uniref:alpha/beta hydrolase n=1 Tax=Streptomyces sp. NPDC047042 TaxID=3154807 RepID=UPI0033EF4CFA
MRTAAPSVPAPGADTSVREVLLDAGGGIRLSGLLAGDPRTPPRATVVAVHGGGMRAGYFHGAAHRDLSLLTLAASLGHQVLAVDRPGYGRSAGALPEGLPLAEQTALLATALAAFADTHPLGAGYFVLAHSYGGKVALTLAARHGELPLRGLAVSGCGHRFAQGAAGLPPGRWSAASRMNNWGPLGLYPPDTFRLAAALTTPAPPREVAELPYWERTLAELAAGVRLPVRFTFAEHERRWRHDPRALGELRGMFPRAVVSTERQPHAGHNISLGWAARSYHLRMLGFLEECLWGDTLRPTKMA